MSLVQRLNLPAAPLYVMDGTAFVFRGFYANRTLHRSDGFPTNALHVVTRILLRILREEKPRHFAFVLDGPGPNFRHELFPLYKANRKATPEDLVRQIEPVKRVVQLLGLPLEVTAGVEADDCIATLARRFAPERPVIIISGDKDLKQCLGPNVYMWDPAAKDDKITSAADFTAATGLAPTQWADVQALIGDSSDNIPGVPGIGPKAAETIFAQYATLEELRESLNAHTCTLPEKIKAKLEGNMEAAFLYRDLARLKQDCCPHLTADALMVQPVDSAGAVRFLREYELLSLVREVESMVRAGAFAQGAGAPTGHGGGSRAEQQGSLLDMAAPEADAPAAQPLPAVAHTAQLPACAGEDVALVPCLYVPEYRRQEGILVAVGTYCARYTGNLSALVAWLAPARRVSTPTLKALLRADPAWASLPPALWFDLGLAAYLANPEERDYSWAHLAAFWAPQLDIPAHEPGRLALALAQRFATTLEQQGLAPLYRELESPLVAVLARMEERGICVDLQAFAAFLREVQDELDQRTTRIYAAAGGEFNIRSAQQLGEVLFNTLQLPTAGKTRGGQLSTAQAALEKLAGRHPVVDAVLEFRTLEKLRSTYLEPLPRLVDADGRIHTTFNQWATATGRLSSSNPNLQNIPVRGPFGKRMRRCFVAPPGRALVSADYSQVELRVLAHMSQDPVLLDAFRRNEDIHTRTAALIFGVAPEHITPDQRRSAKTINFGLIYGMGAQKLAQELKISTAQAREFIDNYFRQLTRLRDFYTGVVEKAEALGYVSTLSGRRRYLPDIHAKNNQAYAMARRQAINTVIQGSAADIIKLAMLAVDADARLTAWDARLILQVHDELVLEVPHTHAREAADRVAALMAAVNPGGIALDIPLLVDAGTGDNWGEAH